MKRPSPSFIVGACTVAWVLSGFLIWASIDSAIDKAEFASAQEPVPSAPPVFGPATVMQASWYGKAYHGRRTASWAHQQGDPKHWRFDRLAMTAAHKTLPFGTVLRVERAGTYVDVTVTDRGPYGEGRDLDLSEAAAVALGMRELGIARVLVRRHE